MRTADTVLGIIRERGRRGLPLEDVYRQLFNPALYLRAYGRIASNRGATTPGVTAETADGMSLAKIQDIIEAIRTERYRWSPARRIYIEKKGSTKKRPLGMPTWSDKLLQEVVRSILDAYYEPQFSPYSHGFRPGRGCHTALREIHHTWLGTAWFIEGDISQCFDSLDHQVLVSILREKIHDNRFLRLIENLLKAGYLESWTYHATYSGTPQGGIASPILSNIYLDKLDQFVEHTLLPVYNRGARRAENPLYRSLRTQIARLERLGRDNEARALRKQLRAVPSIQPDDPDYRRLRYVRYADDFLLGLAGPRGEAEAITGQIRQFLQADLKLALSETKTLLTHARAERARFLGYEVHVQQANHKLHPRYRCKRRNVNGRVALGVPVDVVRAKCQGYLRRNKPIHRLERTHDSVFAIVAQYQQEYRGFAEYYQMASNRSARLTRLRWVMEVSLVKTLAHKLRISAKRVYDRYRATVPTDRGARKVLQVRVERPERPALVAQWGGINLARPRTAVLHDYVSRQPGLTRNDLLTRLLANTCTLCGAQDNIEVHHVRHLKTLRRQGRRPLPDWVERMVARQRKTLVVCQPCHAAIHAGAPAKAARGKVLESRVPRKRARPVRRGADRKGLATR